MGEKPGNPILGRLFRTIIANLYYERFQKENDIHALAFLLRWYAEYLDIPLEELKKLSQTPALFTCGVHWFNLAFQAEQAGCDRETCLMLASKAKEYGAEVPLAFERAEREEKKRQKKEEKEYWDAVFKRQMAEWKQRDAAYNAAYRQVSDRFEQKERAFNLWADGHYASEDEMYLQGKRDKPDFDMYNLWKDKKIRDILNKR